MDINNFGPQHSIDTCWYPNYLQRCANCLVYSFDGSGHTGPCRLVASPCNIRSDIYAKLPSPVFKLRIENPTDAVYFLNKTTGKFDDIAQCQQPLFAHSVNGIFYTESLNDKLIIGFDATELNRFSVGVAFFSENAWRLRLRIVITQKDGVLCFPLFRTFAHQNDVYSIPADFDKNTALILGIATEATELESTLKLRIFANETGLIDNGNDNANERNCYHGEHPFNGTDSRTKFL